MYLLLLWKMFVSSWIIIEFVSFIYLLCVGVCVCFVFERISVFENLLSERIICENMLKLRLIV